jgi:GNAT superfamily N-acetyltransferase
MPIQRRGATPDDLEVLFAISKAALRSYVEATFGPWDEQFQRDLFLQTTDFATHEVFVREGTAIGFWSVIRSPESIDLDRLSLLPEFQGQGIGTALINELKREARKLPIRLQVFPVNPAQRLYRRLGFQLVRTTLTHLDMEWRAAPQGKAGGQRRATRGTL